MEYLLIIVVAHEGGTTMTTDMVPQAQCVAAVDAIEGRPSGDRWIDNNDAYCVAPDGTVYTFTG